MTSAEVADGAKETPLNAAQVCLLALCSGKNAVLRTQSQPEMERKGGRGRLCHQQAGSVGMEINTAFKQIAAQNWAFSEKALQMHIDIEAWETWTTKFNPWETARGMLEKEAWRPWIGMKIQPGIVWE